MTSPDPARRAADPRAAFARHLARHPERRAYLVGFSGGMDSRVLLRVAAAALVGDARRRLRAIHVDHALHPDSAAWARTAGELAEREGVALLSRRVDVVARGEGPEAAARRARYAAFAAALEQGEELLLAHHADDLAETFLLAALRGSGPDGLAAMPPVRPFAGGTIGRPFLDCPRAALARFARASGLEWVEDPSNARRAADRNFLRHEILPRLAERWPAARRTLARAAGRCAAASETLGALADEDLARARTADATVLDVAALVALPRERAAGAIRLWLREAGLGLPSLADLERVLAMLVNGPDSCAVELGGCALRRYRGALHLLPGGTLPPRPFRYRWSAPFAPLAVPEADLVLTRELAARQGIALPAAGALEVRARRGGESILLGEPPFHKSLKKLLQERGVPPWRRGKIPLLFVGERLVAVWGLAVAVDARADAHAVGSTVPPGAGSASPAGASALAVETPAPLDLGAPPASATEAASATERVAPAEPRAEGGRAAREDAEARSPNGRGDRL